MITARLRQRSKRYDHQSLEHKRWILRQLIKNYLMRFFCKFDSVQGLENIPARGPALLFFNHTAFFDPIVVMHALPRNIIPLAKAEGMNNLVFGLFLRLWEVIPVRRESIDREALRRMAQVLEAGEMILMAPEGTRHPDLQQAKEGIAYVAYRGDVPVIPVAIEGTEGFPTLSLKRWRQAGARVLIGRPFCFRRLSTHLSPAHLRQMTDEAMYILAKMLPAHRRGAYADLDSATTDTILFL
jgi:1-acyl-sn-glycerol-3-phosphate acyltransferase